MINVSVSELKNHLSAHLERVQAGDSVLVLDRRKPIAVIEPVGYGTGPGALEALIVSGTVQPPAAPSAPLEFLSLPKGQCGGVKAAILEERDGR